MAYSTIAYHSMNGTRSNTWPKIDTNVTNHSTRKDERYESNETDFEEDMSDMDEYSGRRSEDSVGRSTLDSYDELRTPATHMSEFMTFGLPIEQEPKQMKSVEGPIGPHLFRMSQESTRDVDIYLTLSPAETPAANEQLHQGPSTYKEPPRTSVPLRTWTRQQVAEWMFSRDFDKSICDTFFINDISGTTLIDLQYEDLKELGIASFGQRHKLWTEIKALKEVKLPPPEEDPFVPTELPSFTFAEPVERECSPPSPVAEIQSPASPRRRGRRHLMDEIVSPAESASIVAIEQVLPKSHMCAKGDACKTRQRYLKKMAQIRADFPIEMEQIEAQLQNNAGSSSPVESGLGASIVASIQPSIVASSDVMGGQQPKLRLEETSLKTIQSRDPQESIRQFLSFQQAAPAAEPTTPPYEMFPPISPPKTSAPHMGLLSLPRLQIPAEAVPAPNWRVERTAVPVRQRTPITALNLTQHPRHNDIYRMASPASEMDVPVTAFPLNPVQRDFSNSVPPDMRYGGAEVIPRSGSGMGHRLAHNFSQPFSPIKRSASTAGARNRSGSLTQRQEYLTAWEQHGNAPTVLTTATEFDDLTPTGTSCPDSPFQHEGYMKKRATKMLRREWNEHYFRLKGTQLAMHKDEKALAAIEHIDVDDYAVYVSANSSKLNTALKRLHISKGLDPGAFAFQLVPAADKHGVRHAATGKTHHFAVKSTEERVEWMRELMLVRTKKQKDAVCVKA